MNDASSKLGQLLRERADRLWRQANYDRAAIAAEDYVRWRQVWRKPWYQMKSDENGHPPRWLRRS